MLGCRDEVRNALVLCGTLKAMVAVQSVTAEETRRGNVLSTGPSR